MGTRNRLYILILLLVTLNCSGQNNLVAGPTNVTDYDKTSDLFVAVTVVYSAINVTTSTFNILKLNKPDKYKSNAVVGILSGSLQTAIGLINTTGTYKSAGILTATNVGIGLTTIATSIIRLIKKSPPKESKVTFNLFCLPSADHCTATVGFSVIGRIN